MKKYLRASEETESYIVYVDGEEFETYDFESDAINRANDLCDFDVDDNGELTKEICVDRVVYSDYATDDIETIWFSNNDYIY